MKSRGFGTLIVLCLLIGVSAVNATVENVEAAQTFNFRLSDGQLTNVPANTTRYYRFEITNPSRESVTVTFTLFARAEGWKASLSKTSLLVGAGATKETDLLTVTAPANGTATYLVNATHPQEGLRSYNLFLTVKDDPLTIIPADVSFEINREDNITSNLTISNTINNPLTITQFDFDGGVVTSQSVLMDRWGGYFEPETLTLASGETAVVDIFLFPPVNIAAQEMNVPKLIHATAKVAGMTHTFQSAPLEIIIRPVVELDIEVTPSIAEARLGEQVHFNMILKNVKDPAMDIMLNMEHLDGFAVEIHLDGQTFNHWMDTFTLDYGQVRVFNMSVRLNSVVSFGEVVLPVFFDGPDLEATWANLTISVPSIEGLVLSTFQEIKQWDVIFKQSNELQLLLTNTGNVPEVMTMACDGPEDSAWNVHFSRFVLLDTSSTEETVDFSNLINMSKGGSFVPASGSDIDQVRLKVPASRTVEVYVGVTVSAGFVQWGGNLTVSASSGDLSSLVDVPVMLNASCIKILDVGFPPEVEIGRRYEVPVTVHNAFDHPTSNVSLVIKVDNIESARYDLDEMVPGETLNVTMVWTAERGNFISIDVIGDVIPPSQRSVNLRFPNITGEVKDEEDESTSTALFVGGLVLLFLVIFILFIKVHRRAVSGDDDEMDRKRKELYGDIRKKGPRPPPRRKVRVQRKDQKR